MIKNKNKITKKKRNHKNRSYRPLDRLPVLEGGLIRLKFRTDMNIFIFH
jgi:hypothetical protein